MDSQTQIMLGYHYFLTRAASMGAQNEILSNPRSESERNKVAGSLEATIEQNAFLQQYHAALAPFLGLQPPYVPSPRGNAEEEIALQALQHMKNVPPSSFAGNANASPGAVATRTPRIASVTREEGHPRDASIPSNPSSDVSDHAHVALAALVNRGSPSRAYVKRHEFWKHKNQAERASGVARRSATTSPAESAHFGGEEMHETPETGEAGDGAFDRHVADVDSSDGNDVESPDVEAVGRAAARRLAPTTRGFYDTSGGGEGAPPGAKDELAKEWAALTTWIRMNLHQPRTARRKVLFVGHHPTLNPVPEVETPERAAGESAAGEKRKAPDGASGGGGASPCPSGGKARRTGAACVSSRGRRREEDDFVFVLNPDLDWSDVGHDTRVRMKTLVAETMDIFERKYKKRKVWEWERKVQKYRPPGTNKTFNVPLGNVVRGIQEAYFIFNPDERPEGGGGG